jgi:hypothetical protein
MEDGYERVHPKLGAPALGSGSFRRLNCLEGPRRTGLKHWLGIAVDPAD